VTDPRFEPLVCPECAAGLSGRAQDVALFCTRCGRAFLAGGEDPQPLAVRHVDVPPRAGGGTCVPLPFWFDGAVAAPAFLSARPLTLARAATLLFPSWPVADGFGPAPPLGAILAPGALAAIARLTSIGPATGAAPGLLAVPATFGGSRYRLPGFAFELVPDDVQVGPA
jgi:hypothetical protein